MRVSNTHFFDQAVTQMNRQQSSIAELQLKIGEGKQLLRASDDPNKAMVIQRLNSAVQTQMVFESTLNAVDNRLLLEESSLDTMNDIMLRLKEIAVQGTNGTLSDGDRNLLATEVNSLRDSLFSLANTQDANNNYIFAGSSTGSPAFSEVSGSISYAGDDVRITVDVSDHRQLVLNRPGDQIFTNVTRPGPPETEVSFFDAIDDFSAALVSGNNDALQQGLSDIGSLTDVSINALADLGSRQNTANTQREIVMDTKLRFQQLLSSEEDLDYAAAVTELSAEMMSLEAAQASFAQISALSLFNYIR